MNNDRWSRESGDPLESSVLPLDAGLRRHNGCALKRNGAVLLLALITAACGESTSDPVAFGFAGPIEDSYGASTLQGAELARDEINATGGIRGRPLELRVQDDQADPTTAIAVADELFRDPAVVAVVGHVNSGTMVAAAPVYENGLPAVATSATSPEISRLGDWVFRVATSDSTNAVELAGLARRINEPTAILYANDDYGRGLAASFRYAYEEAGGSVLESDPYLETTEDFRPYLERLRRRDVGLIFVAGLEMGASRIIQQAREMGMSAEFLGGDGVEGLRSMGDMYDGTLVGLLYHPDASPEAGRFAQRFRAAYGREPDSFAALAYDATMLLARAAEQAGADRESIRDYLVDVGRDGGTPEFEGATGTIRFDAFGDPTEKGFAVGVIRDGEIILNGQL
jgi:branched-chain amino acid transport system substrate-binding protein